MEFLQIITSQYPKISQNFIIYSCDLHNTHLLNSTVQGLKKLLRLRYTSVCIAILILTTIQSATYAGKKIILTKEYLMNLPLPIPQEFKGVHTQIKKIKSCIDEEGKPIDIDNITLVNFRNEKGCKNTVVFREEMEPLCSFTVGDIYIGKNLSNNDQVAVFVSNENISRIVGKDSRASYIYVITTDGTNLTILGPSDFNYRQIFHVEFGLFSLKASTCPDLLRSELETCDAVDVEIKYKDGRITQIHH